MAGASAADADWFGGEPSEAARTAAAASAAAAAGRIAIAKSIPVVATRVVNLAGQPNTSALQIARVLEADPASCARLLRLVNSAGYALRIRCTSVRHAVALAGLDNVRNLVVSATLLGLYDKGDRTSAIVLQHGAEVASVCRYLGSLLSMQRELLFTCGLLHDFGKLLLSSTHEGYDTLLAEADACPGELLRRERELLGFDHAVLAEHVLGAWHIPPIAVRVVGLHHDFGQVLRGPSDVAALTAVLRIGNDVSRAPLERDAEAIDAVAGSAAADFVGISPAQVDAVWDDLSALRQRARAAFDRGDIDAFDRESIVPARRSVFITKKREQDEPRETPEDFPCNTCGRTSYGTRCTACDEHACAAHLGKRDGWCAKCSAAYAFIAPDGHNRMLQSGAVTALAGGLVFGGALASGAIGIVTHLDLAATAALWVSFPIVAMIASRWAFRHRFLRQRRVRPLSAAPVAGTRSTRPFTAPSASAGAPDNPPEAAAIEA